MDSSGVYVYFTTGIDMKSSQREEGGVRNPYDVMCGGTMSVLKCVRTVKGPSDLVPSQNGKDCCSSWKGQLTAVLPLSCNIRVKMSGLGAVFHLWHVLIFSVSVDLNFH